MNLEQKQQKYHMKMKELQQEKAALMTEIQESVKKLDRVDNSNRDYVQEQIRKAEAALQERKYDEQIQELQRQLANLETSLQSEKILYECLRNLTLMLFTDRRSYTAHPNISRDRINLDEDSSVEAETPNPSNLENYRDANVYDSDEPNLSFLAHPNTVLHRDPDIAARFNPNYNFIEHPNIRHDRIKRYSNYTKRVTTPIFIGVPKHPRIETLNRAESTCDCKRSSLFEKTTGMRLNDRK